MMIILVLFFFLTPEKTDTFHLEIDLWKRKFLHWKHIIFRVHVSFRRRSACSPDLFFGGFFSLLCDANPCPFQPFRGKASTSIAAFTAWKSDQNVRINDQLIKILPGSKGTKKSRAAFSNSVISASSWS